jgi:hypothetical protein
MRWILTVLGSFFVAVAAQACTIFVLADSNRTLFFNNEDFSNPNTRIWFLPATNGVYGCAYLGFDDGWAQGGVNTEGLAYDWVAGFNSKWKGLQGMKRVRGNSSQRMLESCSTVGQAIEFYRTHLEPSFAKSRILIADRTGASVIIGYQDGKLFLEQAHGNRGFGYGLETLRKELSTPPEPTVANGARILRACKQQGEFATKYSNVFDIRSGDIFLFLPADETEVKLNLASELRKGPHYYDLPELKRQLSENPKPLLNDMNPNFLDEYKPLPDKEPEVTERVRHIMHSAIRGKMRADDYSADLWKQLEPEQKKAQADLKKLGRLEKVVLVGRMEKSDERIYRYRLDFKNASVLQIFTLDNQDKVTFTDSEGTLWK